MEVDEIGDLFCFYYFLLLFLSFIDILSFVIIYYNIDITCNNLYCIYSCILIYFGDLTKQVICCSLTLFDTRSLPVTQTSAELLRFLDLKIFCVSKMYRPLPWISLNCRKGKNSYLFFDIRNRCFKSVVNFLCFENIHLPPSS